MKKYTKEDFLKQRLLRVIIALIGLLSLVAYVFTKHVLVAPTVLPASSASVAPALPIAPLFSLYRIKKGDTLTKIARDFCTTVAVLAKENSIRNPDKIYAGKTLTFVKSETCTPETAKSRTFPEKHVDRQRARASQEKLSSSRPTSATLSSSVTHAKPTVPRPIVKAEGCAFVGVEIGDFSKRILARAECVKQLYGAFIKDAVTQDPRITHIDIVAVMLHESSGNPKAVSASKIPCLGLMQLQPPTAKQYGVDEHMIFDPKENIRGSVRILSAYTYRYFNGSKDHGLAAYNRGPNSKMLHRKDFDPGTLAYVQHVKKISEILITHRFAL